MANCLLYFPHPPHLHFLLRASLQPHTPPTPMSHHLIIFTRYPEPGKTKTRMIPALGAAGAAQLQRQMTEHTLAQVWGLKRLRRVIPEVHFTGATQEQMQDWLGTDWVYRPQGSGDLGERLVAAFAGVFAGGGESAIAIGIDCPSLTPAILNQGFEQLQDHDLVMGSALDGGYYLIGLRQPTPALFDNINWGTSQVQQQTVNIAQNRGLHLAYLPTLQDVDRPEDLPIWEQVVNVSLGYELP
jgi:rSAM/selenodomain-associated transferase 1